MKLSLLLWVVSLSILLGCASAGYHPSYIISDETQEPEPVQEEELR